MKTVNHQHIAHIAVGANEGATMSHRHIADWFGSLIIRIGLLLASGSVVAEAPILFGLVVEPETLMVGTGNRQ